MLHYWYENIIANRVLKAFIRLWNFWWCCVISWLNWRITEVKQFHFISMIEKSIACYVDITVVKGYLSLNIKSKTSEWENYCKKNKACYNCDLTNYYIKQCWRLKIILTKNFLLSEKERNSWTLKHSWLR